MNVLLVSKDPELVGPCKQALRARGHRTKVRADLASARELLSERRPSLVLIDLDIGRDASTALMGQLQTSMQHQDVPVVVTSALLRAGTRFVERCMQELGAACFMERPVPDGDWPLVLEQVYGGELFGEEIRSVSRTVSRSTSGRGVHSHRRQATRRLLRGRSGGDERGGVQQGRIDDEISTWSTSRVNTTGSAGRVRQASGSTTSGRARRVDLESPESLLLRLRRELTILGTVPDRAALAMPLDAASSRAARYARRMKRRYERFGDPIAHSPEVVAVVDDILARLDQAVARLHRPSPSDSEDSTVSSVGPRHSYDDMMGLGRAALSSGRHARAIACFRGARAERPGEAESLAWLGWAIASDSRRPRAERLAEALEYLQLADNFDPSLLEGQLFLARLELEQGEHQVSAARLRRLLKHNPGHTEARKLLDRAEG